MLGTVCVILFYFFYILIGIYFKYGGKKKECRNVFGIKNILIKKVLNEKIV